MKHCCKSMDEFVGESMHEFDPDHMIYYSSQFDEYGIIVHDGGSSYIIIRHCPWCGKNCPNQNVICGLMNWKNWGSTLRLCQKTYLSTSNPTHGGAK